MRAVSDRPILATPPPTDLVVAAFYTTTADAMDSCRKVGLAGAGGGPNPLAAAPAETLYDYMRPWYESLHAHPGLRGLILYDALPAAFVERWQSGQVSFERARAPARHRDTTSAAVQRLVALREFLASRPDVRRVWSTDVNDVGFVLDPFRWMDQLPLADPGRRLLVGEEWTTFARSPWWAERVDYYGGEYNALFAGRLADMYLLNVGVWGGGRAVVSSFLDAFVAEVDRLLAAGLDLRAGPGGVADTFVANLLLYRDFFTRLATFKLEAHAAQLRGHPHFEPGVFVRAAGNPIIHHRPAALQVAAELAAHRAAGGTKAGPTVPATEAAAPPAAPVGAGGGDRPAAGRVLLVCPSVGKACGVAEYTRYVAAGLRARGVTCDVVPTVVAAVARLQAGEDVGLVVAQYEFGLWNGAAVGLGAGETTADLVAGLDQVRGWRPGTGVAVTLHAVPDHWQAETAALVASGLPLVCFHPAAARLVGGTFVEHGVADVPGFTSAPRPAAKGGDGGGPFTLGLFGFFSDDKGVAAAADLCRARAADGGRPLRLVVCSACRTAADRARLRQLLAGVDAAVYDDYAPDAEALRRLSACDALFMPQQFGRAWRFRNNHASGSIRLVMNLGRPVIANRFRGYDGLDGVVLRAETVAEADAVVRRLEDDPAFYADAAGRVAAFAAAHRVGDVWGRLVEALTAGPAADDGNTGKTGKTASGLTEPRPSGSGVWGSRADPLAHARGSSEPDPRHGPAVLTPANVGAATDAFVRSIPPYPGRADYFYRTVYGDKDTFWLAWHRVGRPFAMPARGLERIPFTMCQHDFDGRRVFQHRHGDKWSLAGNRRSAGFEAEDVCRQFLQELRRECRPLTAIAPHLGPDEWAAMAALADRPARFVRPGHNAWPARLGADGTVAEGASNDVFYWWVDPPAAAGRADGRGLVLAGHDGRVTARLVRQAADVWAGPSARWPDVRIEVRLAGRTAAGS